MSLMAQGAIDAESGILARPCLDDNACFFFQLRGGIPGRLLQIFSEATLLENHAAPNLRRALWHHCEGGEPHIYVGNVFEILHDVFE